MSWRQLAGDLPVAEGAPLPTSSDPRQRRSAAVAVARAKTPIFYGWYVVAAIALITTITSGLAFYNLSILLAAFVAERGFPVALASSATAAFFVASALGGLLSGAVLCWLGGRLGLCPRSALRC